ncbi:hypothetical protein OAK87_01385 [bacterium]|nr:hypothetical protein [bacterium]
MEIKQATISKCDCCNEQTITLPLDEEDLFESEEGTPDLALTIEEAEELIIKLSRLLKCQ